MLGCPGQDCISERRVIAAVVTLNVVEDISEIVSFAVFLERIARPGDLALKMSQVSSILVLVWRRSLSCIYWCTASSEAFVAVWC